MLTAGKGKNDFNTLFNSLNIDSTYLNTVEGGGDGFNIALQEFVIVYRISILGKTEQQTEVVSIVGLSNLIKSI